MNEFVKTISFVVFGLVLAGIAYWVNDASQPAKSEIAELIGEPFYGDFTSAKQAKSLKVTAIDQETAEMRTFSVEYKNGLWRIPTHHDYPAEAAERLATTATSVMGIVRQAVAGDQSSRHKLYGVVDPASFDPASEEDYDLESYGQRITLRDGSDEVLADFIIGREAEGEEDEFQQNFTQEVGNKRFYIRRADEPQTYIAELKIDLSTRFSDWIDPDLLQVDESALRRIKIDSYELRAEETNPLSNIQPLRQIQIDQFVILRDDDTAPWTLDGFNPETETLVNNRINEIVNVVGALKIVGVRPRLTYQGQQLLTSDFQVNPIEDLQNDPEMFRGLMQRLQVEMSNNGFNFVNSGGLKLVSQSGEVLVGTESGAVYQLSFGTKVSGDEKMIEIGGAAAAEADSDKEDGEKEGSAEEGGEEANSDEETVSGDNRYLMVRVFFDESLLGGAPVLPMAPKAPVKPEGYVSKAEGGENAATQVDDRDPAFIEYDHKMQAYEQLSMEHELARTRYQDELKKYNEKIEAGKRKSEELNSRFGQWYYVISAENLSVLQSARDDIAQPKATPPGQLTPQVLPQRPDISFEFPADFEFENGDDGETADSASDKKESATEAKNANEDSESDNADKSETDDKSESDQPLRGDSV